MDGDWIVKNTEKSINVPAQVPGTVFESLIENKIIEDPFYGVNEHGMKWIYDSEWIYENKFDVENHFLEHKNIILCFHGLDTISEVSLNGQSLGSTENMFIKYYFNVKDILKNIGNTIQVKFKSPTKKGQQEIEKYNVNLNTGYAAIPGVPYLRKAQFSFGWDWGPKLPDVGIWKSVELVGYGDIKIASVHPFPNLKYKEDPLKLKDPNEFSVIEPESVKLIIKIEIDSTFDDLSKLDYKISVKVKAPNNEVVLKEFKLKKNKEIFEFDIENPLLWWTHDLGTPNLYTIETTIIKGVIIDSLSQRIGLRDIRLIRENDKWGESFFFLLNGIPVFAKGANWIPIDSFIPRGKKLGLYSMNLNYAKNANMNMIRVWGGGIYEDDTFYDFCDELGLLVWQDFPYACAIYPSYEGFLENIKIESMQNIKRIRHHPSLALWCGNNEIEQLWKWELNISGIAEENIIDDFKLGYIKIFENLLPKLIKEHDPNRTYWPSSPSNGYVGENIGRSQSNSPDSGDSHFWEVWHRNKPFSEYRKFNSRFMSEFGFESFPSLKTLREFCTQDQFDFYSPIMENHQKNSAGNKKIMDYMEKRFSIPEKFEQQVILSQLTQAEAIEYGVEHWRQNRNNNHCMGSLYWQLNDCWPVASWSSLDYFGRWKALHYFAKRFYQPIFASVKADPDQIELWVINDLKISYDISFEWKILNSDGVLLMEGVENAEIASCTSLRLNKIELDSINKDKNLRQKKIIFYKLKDNNKASEVIHQGFRLFVPPKDFPLQEPEISFLLKEMKQQDDNLYCFELNINTQSIALFIFIESDLIDFIASDNFFSLEPCESRIIQIKTVKILYTDITEQEIIDSFKINSLYNLIN